MRARKRYVFFCFSAYCCKPSPAELRLRLVTRARNPNPVCSFRRYDNLTVTLQHDTENEGHFCTLLARGSPYMTFEFAGATPRITSNGAILQVDTKPQLTRKVSFKRSGECYVGASWMVKEHLTGCTIRCRVAGADTLTLGCSPSHRPSPAPNIMDEMAAEILVSE